MQADKQSSLSLAWAHVTGRLWSSRVKRKANAQEESNRRKGGAPRGQGMSQPRKGWQLPHQQWHGRQQKRAFATALWEWSEGVYGCCELWQMFGWGNRRKSIGNTTRASQGSGNYGTQAEISKLIQIFMSRQKLPESKGTGEDWSEGSSHQVPEVSLSLSSSTFSHFHLFAFASSYPEFTYHLISVLRCLRSTKSNKMWSHDWFHVTLCPYSQPYPKLHKNEEIISSFSLFSKYNNTKIQKE